MLCSSVSKIVYSSYWLQTTQIVGVDIKNHITVIDNTIMGRISFSVPITRYVLACKKLWLWEWDILAANQQCTDHQMCLLYMGILVPAGNIVITNQNEVASEVSLTKPLLCGDGIVWDGWLTYLWDDTCNLGWPDWPVEWSSCASFKLANQNEPPQQQ